MKLVPPQPNSIGEGETRTPKGRNSNTGEPIAQTIRPSGVESLNTLLPNLSPLRGFSVNGLLGIQWNPVENVSAINIHITNTSDVIDDNLGVFAVIIIVNTTSAAHPGGNPSSSNPSHQVLPSQSTSRALMQP